MSSSIPIPTARNPAHRSAAAYSPSSSSSYASSSASLSDSPVGKGKGKGKEREIDVSAAPQPRRQSLLGSSLSKSEHTVVDLGAGGGMPRLVSCVKSSQGFDWNQELFLPSYADYESQDLERKQDPVQDIILTDEEVAAMFPQ
ncbi:hypothetical protein WHR41_04785 [Cladosporium halotolerans]|uniref:Uncharacterized protein n=1 Tax=Cladosporium halotolerans TaxID=1052096 RepID=A0AB34KMK6_9PEZI